MSLEPNINFDEGNVDPQEQTILSFVTPLSNSENIVTIADAGTSSKGVLTTTSQSISGVKTFNNRPVCSAPVAEDNELASKSYVDSVLSSGIKWGKDVTAFLDFSGGVPTPIAEGTRYIATTDWNTYDKNNIYTYTRSSWVETIPDEGTAVYNRSDTGLFANSAVLFNGTDWIRLGQIYNQSLNTYDDAIFHKVAPGSIVMNDKEITSISETITTSSTNAQMPTALSVKNYVDTTVVTERNYVNNPIGFITRSDSQIRIVDSTFRIDPYPTSFSYFCVSGGNVTKFTKTAGSSIILNDGPNYIYFDGATLAKTASFTQALVNQHAIVAFAYLYGGLTIILADERHGCSMSPATHYHLHNSMGTVYVSGCTPTMTIATGAPYTTINVQVDMSTGVILDEDLEHNLKVKGYTDLMKVLYLTGTTASPTWTNTENTGPFVQTGIAPSNYFCYNHLSNGNWSLTQIQDGKYVLGHIFATNSYSENSTEVYTQYFGICGQTSYDSVDTARTAAQTELENIYSVGLPMPEFCAVATVIYRRRNTANIYNGHLVYVDANNTQKFVDFRRAKITGAGATTTSHSALSNLNSDDHVSLYVKLGGRTGDTVKITGTSLVTDKISDGTNDQIKLNYDPEFGYKDVVLQSSTAIISKTGDNGAGLALDIRNGTPQSNTSVAYIGNDGTVTAKKYLGVIPTVEYFSTNVFDIFTPTANVYHYIIVSSYPQQFDLPATTNYTGGETFTIYSKLNGSVLNVRDNGGNIIQSINPGQKVVCIWSGNLSQWCPFVN